MQFGEDNNYETSDVRKYLLTLAASDIENAPTIEAEPVKHGKWFLLNDCANTGVYCSICHKKVFREDSWYANVPLQSTYCPNCGARMDGD